MTARRLPLRLLLPAAAVALVFPLVCGLAIAYALQQRQVVERQETLVRTAALVGRSLTSNSADSAGSNAAIAEQLRTAAAATGARLVLLDSSGHVLVDSVAVEQSPGGGSDHAQEADQDSGQVSGQVLGLNSESAVSEKLFPDRADSPVLYLVDRRAQWFGPVLLVALVAGVAAMILVAGAFYFWVVRQWLLPSRKLVRCAEQLSGGQWQSRVRPEGAGELQLLASRLNALGAEAHKELADLDGRRAGLQALVDALPDPILLTDAARRIAMINLPAARLFSIAPAKAIGKKLVSIVTDEAIVGLIEPIGGHGIDHRTDPRPGADHPSDDGTTGWGDGNAEVPGRGKNGSADPNLPHLTEVRLMRKGQRLTYQALTTRTRAGGVLLVLRDVSRHASQAQMKTDFVANASHELRTPVAAIQVAFETMREVYLEDPKQMARCEQVIEGNLKRLGDILGDLLDLSRVENANLEPQFAPIVFEDLFALLETTLGPVAGEKKVNLVCAPGHPETLLGDRRLLDLILKNLVDNAIKFTPTNGTVTVSLAQTSTDDGQHGLRPGVILSVTDSGIGIAPEFHERVFERFFQVNQGRAAGVRRGTGLGLAIVRHAVHAMGGRIHVQSNLGQGTSMICEFPQIQGQEVAPLTSDSDKMAVSILQSISNSREEAQREGAA
jgi:signal transduction histidine kinase/PAS domain-containing protein